ncbi:MAG: prepilin-type N-terminal cleavage/methylation domain-containing protein [Planctomycetaceae bacterium]|nr:prepilin-type N-terminal cleavage/methylation domain-containing protein [Planctomycetaceae bacterium]
MRQQPSATRSARHGFTLVEMLVSVALVLVIMTMFASAFQIATGTLLKHRGIAENDQRARAAVAILDGDLTKRSFQQSSTYTIRDIAYPLVRDPVVLDAAEYPVFGDPTYLTDLANRANQQGLGIVPLHPDYFNATTRNVDVDERGYFYISENDPDNDVDDVLQFTMDGTELALGNTDELTYKGRARPLSTPTWPLPADQDQPIWDDGVGFTSSLGSFAANENGTGESELAEVSYFVRNGNLYRRVLLIRQPRFPSASGTDDQPYNDTLTQDFIPGNYTTTEDLTPTALGVTDFWNDFDYSASRLDAKDGSSPTPKMFFHWSESLQNTSTGNIVDGKYLALGNPQNRFGHDPSPRLSVTGLQGRPKEYMDPTLIDTYIGRYTHEETSSQFFLHPGLPYANGGTVNVLTPFSPGYDDAISPGDAVPDEFDGGLREAEDLLLPNVHAFDIEVWDAAIQQWVDLGHLNGGVGGDGDWHQDQIIDGSGSPTFPDLTAGNTVPPHLGAVRHMYRYGSLDASLAPTSFNRIFDTWHPGFDFDTTDTSTLDDIPPFRPLWTDRTNFAAESGNPPNPTPTIWQASTAYAVGDRVFPTATNVGAGTDYPPHLSLFYEVIPGGAGTSGAAAPGWGNKPGDNVTDNGVTWIAVNNTIGLQAIRITIRFLDPTSQQMRQVSLVHTLAER